MNAVKIQIKPWGVSVSCKHCFLFSRWYFVVVSPFRGDKYYDLYIADEKERQKGKEPTPIILYECINFISLEQNAINRLNRQLEEFYSISSPRLVRTLIGSLTRAVDSYGRAHVRAGGQLKKEKKKWFRAPPLIGGCK